MNDRPPHGGFPGDVISDSNTINVDMLGSKKFADELRTRAERFERIDAHLGSAITELRGLHPWDQDAGDITERLITLRSDTREVSQKLRRRAASMS
jgi:hypothetical protein